MTLHNLFTVPIHKSNLKTNNEQLKTYALQLASASKGRNVSNTGFQSQDLDKDITILSPLVHTLLHQCRLYAGACQFNFSKYDLICDNIWANVNYTHDYNHIHTHPHTFISGVYYVQVDKNMGGINFIHNIECLQYDWPSSLFDGGNSYNASSYFIQPQEGDCILFPSWLRHEVTANKSNSPRISYAFNVKVVENDSEKISESF